MKIIATLKIIKYFKKQNCKILHIYLNKISNFRNLTEMSKNSLLLIFELKEV